MWWTTLIGVVVGLVMLWLVLVGLLWRALRRQRDKTGLRDVLRLVPDVIRLLRRLAADGTLPTGVRVRMVLVLGYLASPIDLIPDFIPILGYVDDAVIVVIAIRSITRRAGTEALRRHWPGTTDGLRALLTLTGPLPTHPDRR